MANSNQSAVSDGTLVLLQVSIDYLNREDISVYFNGVLNALPWEWVGDTDRSISFSPAVPFGTTVTLRRTTNVDEVLHVFSGGAAFKFNTVDDNFRQTLLTVQEFQEGARITDLFNDLDMHGYRIINQLAVSGEGFIFKGNWLPNTQYGVNNIVYVADGGAYQGSSIICKRNHVSVNLVADFSSNWEIFAARGASGPGSGDLVSANNLSDIPDKPQALATLGGAKRAGDTFTGDVIVPSEAYSSILWLGDLSVPTKSDVRNELEDIKGTVQGIATEVASIGRFRGPSVVANGGSFLDIPIPVGAVGVDLVFDEVSTNSVSYIKVRAIIGTGPVLSGYSAVAWNRSTEVISNTGFFAMFNTGATSNVRGKLSFDCIGNNIWVESGVLTGSFGGTPSTGDTSSGRVSLASPLTGLRVLTDDGTSLFDSPNGTITPFWHF